MSKKIAAACAAALALALFAPAAQAQKALVYCPVGLDATGCDRIVAALQPKFPDGVDRGYDGTNSTVDLMKVDLEHYAVIVVPSLADDDTKQPYSVLRKAAARLHLAVNGRVAVYSGAPDQGSANRADKDAIIQNLAAWSAKGHTRATGLVGLVAFLDLSENASARYSWVKSVSLADVSADAETQSIADLTPSGRGGDLLASAGQAIRFSNMASYGLHIGARAAARTEVGAMSTTTDSHQSVLVTYANADGKDLGTNGGRPGGASFDVSGGGGAAGPTLTTNKPDYLPGDTVLFGGTGWAPNDTVTITIHEDPQWSNPDRTVTAVADGNGNLSSHDFVVQPRDFGVTFTATAVGNPSGLVAQTSFTDGSSTITGVVTDAVTHAPIAGATVTCSKTGTNGCNSDATATTDGTGAYSLSVNFSGNNNTVRLTASASGYNNAIADVAVSNATSPIQNFQLTTVGPTKLAFPNAAVTGVVNQCLTINIQTQNAGGTPTAVTSNTTVNLTTDNGSTGAGAFYTSNACTTTTTTIQINSGSSSGTLFYEATARGNGTHNLTVSATGLTQASQAETINKANQTALTITAPTAGTFGDKLTITTTGGSGTGALSFSAGASTACSIVTTPGPDLNKLQITSGTGTCSITATKATDNDFNSVTSAPQTVTVSKATPVFSNLSSQTITFGTPTTTFTGKLASGALIPTGNVSITLGTTPPVNQAAAIAVDGTFSSTFNTATVLASPTPYTMTYAFTADNNFAAANDAATTLTVNKANQTITFSTLPNKTFGDADFTVTATATSGLAVTFSLGATDQCTITVALVHLTGAGSCTVKADQIGNSNYNPAPQVPQTFSIGKATPVVIATGGTFPYDGLAKAGTGTATGVGGANLTPVTLSYAGTGTTTYGPTATAPTNAGTYTVTATFAGDANYLNASSTPAALTITPKTLAIKANDRTKTYGDVVTFAGTEFTPTGLVSGETIGSVTLTSLGAAATAAIAGSPYVITASTPTGGTFLAANYSISFQPGALTVNTKALTITANDRTKTYGDVVTFAGTEFTAPGLINGDVVNSVTLMSPAAAANAGVAGSPYKITPSAAVGTGLGNYVITYADGKLTVSTKALTVTANNRVKTYGDAVTFAGTEFTPSGLVNAETIGSVTLTSAGAAATAGVAGSPYPIIPSAATGGTFTPGNYTISYANGTLTVNPKALAITANDRTKTYGDVVTFAGTEFTAPGLINGDVVTSVTLTSLGVAANAGVAGSPYSITPSAAVGTGLGNYVITYCVGKLTVNPKALSIKANDRTKTYGDVVTFLGTEFTPMGLVNSETVGTVTLTSAGAAATALVAGSPYAIVASNAAGGSFAPGNYTISYVDGALTVSPKPLTITANDRTKTYGDAVTFAGTEFTAPGLVNGDAVASVTLTSAGAAATASVAGSKYDITASAAAGTGLGNYAITYGVGKLTVNPKALSIKASDRTKTYGDVVTFLGTEFTPMGLVNSETVGTVTLTSAGAAVTATVALSPYAIVASNATGGSFTPGNYTISYTDGAVTVNAKPLTITANDRIKTYGDAVGFAGTEFSAPGLINGDVVNSVTLMSAGAAANAGVVGSPYIITASVALGTGLGNYAITYAVGHLTVNAKALTITANNRIKTYGDAVTFAGTEFTPSGLVLGEMVGSVTLMSGGASAAAAVVGSPYTITPSAATGGTFTPGNYAITYATGTLTVKPKPLNVKADDKSRVYGEPNPTFTATITGFVNGDPLSVVSGAASISTTANASSTVGASPYPITISKGTLTAANYTFETADGATFTNGNLAVTPASTTVSSANQALNEGVTSIPLSATVTALAPSTATVGEGSVTFHVTGPNGFSQTPSAAAVAAGSASTSYSQVGPIPPGSYGASVAYADLSPGNFNPSNTSASIGISNVPPSITGVTYSGIPVQINMPTTISGTFTDPGLGDGAYTLTINLSVLGTFSCSTTAPSSGCSITAPTSGGPGTFTLTQTFSTASVNVVTVTVADAFGGSDTKKQDTYLVMYDPNGGFVTGGGWINSPDGACLLTPGCLHVTGKATFGFVSKYKKGQSTPDGDTEFQFHEGNLNFKSTAYDWLVLAGTKAQYKGSGTINGSGDYGFMLTAIDGDLKSKGSPDTFRIKIWDKATGNTVYDNQPLASDSADPTTALGGGSIQIHGN